MLYIFSGDYDLDGVWLVPIYVPYCPLFNKLEDEFPDDFLEELASTFHF